MAHIYIWYATQSEPGMHGVRYAATPTSEAPAGPDPVRHHSGLIYQESLYDDWRLLGTAQGQIVEMRDGETGIEDAAGRCWPIEDFVVVAHSR